MRPDDIAVVIAAIVAIGWVNWYFFVAGDRRADGRGSGQRDSATCT